MTLAGRGDTPRTPVLFIKYLFLIIQGACLADAKTLEYLDIPSFRNAAGQDASAYKCEVILEWALNPIIDFL